MSNKNQKNQTFEDVQKNLLTQFEKMGIKGQIGQPHLQRDNASLIIPKNTHQKNVVLK